MKLSDHRLFSLSDRMFAPCSSLKAPTRNISPTANSGTIARSVENPRESIKAPDTSQCVPLSGTGFVCAGRGGWVFSGRRNVPLQRCPHLLYNPRRRKVWQNHQCQFTSESQNLLRGLQGHLKDESNCSDSELCTLCR